MSAKRTDIDLRKEGFRALRLGRLALSGDRPEAQRLLRQSLEFLVEAFLEDRASNRDLFVVAHRVGLLIETEFGCTYEFDEKASSFTPTCPIFSLHSRLGVSIAGFSRGRCSICEAEDFECEHVPGESYEGQQCVRVIYDFRLDHVALTPNPDFTSTFMKGTNMPLREVEAVLGRGMRPGERLLSNHCRDCYGRLLAKADDIDQSLWDLTFGESSEEGVQEEQPIGEPV